MIEIPKDFPWRPGMLTMLDERLSRRTKSGVWVIDELAGECDGESSRCHERLDRIVPAEPNLTDPATLGALLGAVRDAWRSPHAYVRRNGTIRTDDNRIVPAWEVCDLYLDDEGAKAIGASQRGGVQCALLLSEAEALLAAWNARPVKA